MKRLILILLSVISAWGTALADGRIVSYVVSETNSLPNRNVRMVYQDSAGLIYFIAPHDVTYSYDGYSFRVVTNTAITNKLQENKATETEGVDNRGNRFALIDSETILLADKETGEHRIKLTWPQERKLFEKYRLYVCQDNRGHVWVSAYGFGLVLYDKQTHTQQIVNQATGLIDSDQVVFIMVDRDDNLWVVQDLGAVRCLSISDERNERIMLEGSGRDAHNEIRLLHRLSNGTLIIGNNNGQVFACEAKALTQKRMRRLDTPELGYLCAETDADGRLWLGSRRDGVVIGGKCYGAKRRIDCIFRDSKGRMWKGGLDDKLGIASFDGRQYKEQSIGIDSVRIIREDRLGRIWVGSDEGLYVGNVGNFMRLMDGIITSLLDCGDRMYVGTYGKGLFVADINEVARPVVKPQPLPSLLPDLYVEAMVMNRDGVLFISTENGSVHYDVAANRLKSVYFRDSQRHNYYYDNCVALLDDGAVAFGSASGISVQYADFSAETKPKHPMAVTDSTVTADLVMFSFSRFDYSGNIRATQFSFLLEGYDRQWSEPSAQNSVSYRRLPYGDYTLHVRWREDYGEWEEISICFAVPTPWWLTWWAYMIYLAVAVGVGMIAWHQVRRIARLRQMIAVEKQLTEFKLVFFTNISHEFRMPLTIIQAAIDRILSAGTPPVKLHEPISSMSQSVKRMRRLTDQLLLFRKMQNNRLSVAVQDTDLPQFLKNIFLTFREVADGRGIKSDFLPQSWHFDVPIDRDYIDKAMYNLLSNAFKYTPSGGVVTMRARMENDTVCITVEDSGCGISKEKQRHLFDRYVTGKLSPDSIGIGLNLTASLIDAHHGTIGYREREGGGSIFTITFPASIEAYSQNERLQASELQNQTDADFGSQAGSYKAMMAQPLNAQKILIVEDDNDVALLIQRETGELFHTDIASSAAEALRKIETANYDLIITDMTMPKMSGLAMAKKIRQGVRNCDIPIILLTGNIDEDLKTKALQTGINVFMTKPFNAEQLRAHCVNLLKSKPSIAPTETVLSNDRQARFLTQISQTVESRIGDTTLNVDTLAEIFKMSRTALNTKVRTLTGLSPAEFIRHKRIELAKSLLNETDLTIGEIGNKIGMPTPQSFNVTFKKITGLSPSDFRNGKKTAE